MAAAGDAQRLEWSAAILAGGRGERFGGSKPLGRFRGGTLLGHLLEQLAELGPAPRGPSQLLVAAREIAPLRSVTNNLNIGIQIDWLEERAPPPEEGGPERRNPLFGLRAALEASRRDWVYALAADMPFAADPALISALLAAREAGGSPAAQRKRESESGQREPQQRSLVTAVAARSGGSVQPLCALWNRERALPELAPLLREGSGGPKRLLERLRARVIDWTDPRPFLDADTRDELNQLEQLKEGPG